jgi:hypothetical protein
MNSHFVSYIAHCRIGQLESTVAASRVVFHHPQTRISRATQSATAPNFFTNRRAATAARESKAFWADGHLIFAKIFSMSFRRKARIVWLLIVAARGKAKEAECARKWWEIIADNLSKAGFSWGCVSAIDSNGQTIWIADAHRNDGKRFVAHAEEKLTAFLELERVMRESLRFLNAGSTSQTWTVNA